MLDPATTPLHDAASVALVMPPVQSVVLDPISTITRSVILTSIQDASHVADLNFSLPAEQPVAVIGKAPAPRCRPRQTGDARRAQRE